MPVGYERLTRASLTPEETAELAAVDGLATRLRQHLDASEADIDLAHVHAASSGAIQAIASTVLTRDLGFREEVVLRAEEGFTIRARPDFIFRLADGRGVLGEVERGGTTTNNHDLKDFWKAHIAPDAHHLFSIWG